MLYFVATPIGNLNDFSLRAIETLKSVDEIGCEDTRHSITLLNHYEIKKPLFSYHKYNEKESGEKIIEKLKNGKNIAIISDAGTPIISDPGNILVKMLIENGLDFTVIPGACAFINALILSGADASRFCFLGFLPEKKSERESLLKKYKNIGMTTIFYSAPHDVMKDLNDIYAVFGNRSAIAVKEITKIHERAERFFLSDITINEPKGEYVIVIEKGEEENEFLSLTPKEHIDKYIKMGYDKKEALKLVAKERNVPKSSLYKYTIEK